MHIVVAGASGRTGRLVVERALTSGHRVTAIVRAGSEAAVGPGAEILRADVLSGAGLDLPGDADAVVSALGMRPGDEQPVSAPGTTSLIAAMRRAGLSRIVVVSAVPAFTTGGGEPWWFRIVRTLVRRAMPAVYTDIAAMENVLRSSGLRWTILRPGYLTDGAPTDYRLLPDRNATTPAHRSDLAHALLALAEDDAAVGHGYGLRRGRAGRAEAAA